ncbi:hypothetical protein VNO78_21546 [Psophocarpus tetragonolobus]|uniref:Uncharacterized protein n=1 Tax=Psophocarpus tetragonolobus TaxID=3891 RepID=A0AAN9SFH5_PSOTE
MSSEVFGTLDLGTNNMSITNEEFFSFHNIDRQLFTRLVVELCHDPSQSTHVMAFFMWLEKKCKNMNLMKSMLQWPNIMLESLVKEAILVLNCIEGSQFIYDHVNDESLPLIKSILQNQDASLNFFYHNRVFIIGAVTRFLKNVCERAFKDIVEEVEYTKAMNEKHLHISNINQTNSKEMIYCNVMHGAPIVSQQGMMPTTQWTRGSSSSLKSNINSNHPLETCYVSSESGFSQDINELLAMVSQTSITPNTSDEKNDVTIDDRIIFMTFSKGYPISEEEVRDFFTRRYGDIIETLHMQEVVPTEQPLYARVVIRAEAIHMIDHFLESTNKVKLSINGKHAWARKYIRRGAN